jgi:hypothetical protein
MGGKDSVADGLLCLQSSRDGRRIMVIASIIIITDAQRISTLAFILMARRLHADAREGVYAVMRLNIEFSKYAEDTTQNEGRPRIFCHKMYEIQDTKRVVNFVRTIQRHS